jgi:hypothetical protein
MGERVRVWLYVLVCRARFALERANGYQLVPGVPPSPLYQLRGTPGDWDTAATRELGGK